MGIKDFFMKAKSSIKDKIDLELEERKADRRTYQVAKSEARQVRRSTRAEQIKQTSRTIEEQRGQRIRDKIAQGPRFGGFNNPLLNTINENKEKPKRRFVPPPPRRTQGRPPMRFI